MSLQKVNEVRNRAGDGPTDLFQQIAAKVWAHLDGTGTIGLYDSFNIASIIDDGVGLYTHNLTNNMADANYSVPSSCTSAGGTGTGICTVALVAAGSYQGITVHDTGSAIDSKHIHTVGQGDLA